MQTFDYIFNIGGNYSATIKGILKSVICSNKKCKRNLLPLPLNF